MNQSCFTLGFLSQNSLWKLSFIYGYKGYLYWGEKSVKRQVFQNRSGSRLGLATWLSREIQSRDNRMASCTVCPVVLYLAWLFTFWHAWHVCYVWRLESASHPREQAASLCFLAHSWAINTLSHSLPLQQTHLNTGLLNAEIQITLVWNKANKMVD